MNQIIKVLCEKLNCYRGIFYYSVNDLIMKDVQCDYNRIIIDTYFIQKYKKMII